MTPMGWSEELLRSRDFTSRDHRCWDGNSSRPRRQRSEYRYDAEGERDWPTDKGIEIGASRICRRISHASVRVHPGQRIWPSES